MRFIIGLVGSVLFLALGFGAAAGSCTLANAVGLSRDPAPGKGAPEAEEPQFAGLAEQDRPPNALVLMYHDVIDRRTRETEWFDITTAELEEQLDFIQERGGTVISLDQLQEALAGKGQAPMRSVVLTFDDSYLSFYEKVVPILEARQIPATVYVHTDFIGSPQGRPKMNWDHLKELAKNPLVTIASHTKAHYEDLAERPEDVLRDEIFDSKKILEEGLGKPVEHISWPVGSYSQQAIAMAMEAGYETGVTMEEGQAAQSASILALKRWNPLKLEAAWESLEPWLRLTPGAEIDWAPSSPVRKEIIEDGRLTLAVVRGGSPESVLVDGREQVPDLVEEHGGVAGINGGFFVMAAIRATDNSMIGPCLPGNRTDWVLDTDEERLRKIAGRPLVMWSPEKIAFRPFRPDRHMDPSGIEAELPGLTDAFVAGAWLVSDGRAFLEDEIKPFSAQDSHEIRPRTFIGVTREGELVVGASLGSASTARLAQAALAAGCMEAVLLDSGYSTSLVYDGELLAVGHRTRSVKSRPIPHAIILKGTLASAENTTQP
jgi:peptidoglycan/xylan/chitin deacetylase (PgdA/CDA1 family)